MTVRPISEPGPSPIQVCYRKESLTNKVSNQGDDSTTILALFGVIPAKAGIHSGEQDGYPPTRYDITSGKGKFCKHMSTSNERVAANNMKSQKRPLPELAPIAKQIRRINA